MHEKLTASNEFHDKEDLLIRLKDVLHTHQKWMVSLHKDIFLQKCWLDLIIVKNDILSQRFHSVNGLSLVMLDQEDFTEASFSNYADDFEVLKIGRLFLRSFLE